MTNEAYLSAIELYVFPSVHFKQCRSELHQEHDDQCVEWSGEQHSRLKLHNLLLLPEAGLYLASVKRTWFQTNMVDMGKVCTLIRH